MINLKKILAIIFLICLQTIPIFSATTVCKSDNTSCYTITQEFGVKNELLALYYSGLILFWVFVWLHVKDYKPKGKIWESPQNFFHGYTKLMCWFWIIMIIMFYWLRLLFASHTDDYFNQVISWWDTWLYITLFPYMFFAMYYIYRKILQLPPMQRIINDVKGWWK